MTAHRHPPLPAWFNAAPAGVCRWCNAPVLFGAAHKNAGQPNTRRNWHDGREGEPDCLGVYFIATRSDSQRRAVFARDGGKCHDCGETPAAQWRVDPGCRVWAWPRTENIYVRDETVRARLGDAAEWRGNYIVASGPYMVVDFIERHTWEADHDFPLWLVDRSKPFQEIIRYWSIDNLVTRCLDCHKRKSAEEAAQRAKGKRLRGLTGNDPKRKIQSRPFDTTKVRTFSGEVREKVGRAVMR